MVAPGEVRGSAGLFGRIADEAGLPAWVTAEGAALAATAALADRLTAGQAHALVAALPQPLRDELGARPREHHPHGGGMIDLVDRVARELGIAPSSAELVVCAVFRELTEELPAELVAHVAQQLPADLRAAWLARAATTEEEVTGDLQLTKRMLDDIERTAGLPLRVSPREAFASVMCIFARRLSGGDARELFLGLPRTLRQFVERGMLERREEPLAFGTDELVASVAQDLGTDLEGAEAIVAAVIAAVTRALPREEIAHVASQLPEDLRALWLA